MACLLSTYLFQCGRQSPKVGIKCSFDVLMKILTKRVPRGDLIATPSNWIYIFPLNIKWTCFVHKSNKSLTVFLGKLVLFYFCHIPFLNITAIVSSKEKLVNKLLPSNDIILYPSSIVSFLTYLIKSCVLVAV